MESWSTRSRRRKPPESIYTPLDMSSFVPSVIADTVSVNVTRFLLRQVATRPKAYTRFLGIDSLVAVSCYYLSFVVANYDVWKISHVFWRSALHPFAMIALVFDTGGELVLALPVLMAATTAIPTILHSLFVGIWLALRWSIPALTWIRQKFVERVVEMERHPIASTVILAGIALLPLEVLRYLLASD